MTNIFFDDSLPLLVKTLTDRLGQDFVEKGTIVRDASGRLSFFSNRVANYENEVEELTDLLEKNLGQYVRASRPIVFSDQVGASTILNSDQKLPVNINGIFCYVLDRRIVGSGWLDKPEAVLANPPRIVFSTLKGGVGRSTALVIAASDLSSRGKNVLIIDLDLEAPGLGDLILSPERLPTYGVIDYLVENGLGGIPDEILPLFIGTSELTSSSGGRVDVLPALGTKSSDNPSNVLSKLSRAMIEDITEEGSVSVSSQISGMINRIVTNNSYDVILIDCRAGLSELTAPAILGLGATVLLFGTAQRQTIEGYRSLFSALQLLAQRDLITNSEAEWRMHLRPVYAKSSLKAAVAQQFQDDFYELFSAHIYDKEDENASDDALIFNRDDVNAPHWPITIAFNQNFLDFDPSRNRGQLDSDFYEQAFRPFLNAIDGIIQETSD